MSGFKPSALAVEEIYLDDLHHPSSIEVNHTNSMFETEAENSVAPFLALNISKDSQRRNYVIGRYGQAVYRESDEPVKVPFPRNQRFFGHDDEPVNQSAPRKTFHEEP
jgi:hypothetical protein